MYLGLKIRRLFKVWASENKHNKNLNTASKKVTGMFLYPKRNLSAVLLLLEAGIILTKLPETQASPDQNSSLNSNDKAKKR